MNDDPFAVLGLTPDATLDQVRVARRRLAAQFHPDHGGSAAKMGEINAAFDRAVATLTGRHPAPAPAPAPAPNQAAAQPARHSPRHRGVQQDAPSFTIDRLPVEAFEALLVVASWMGEVLVDDPPYVLELHLHEPGPCWCRLDLVPDAGASTVTLTIAAVGDQSAPDVEEVRDAFVANLNLL